jgi:hypothetical protein
MNADWKKVQLVRIPWSIIVQQLNSPNATSFQYQKYVDFYSPNIFLFVYTSNTSQIFSYMHLNFDNDESLKNSKDTIFPDISMDTSCNIY